MIQALLTSLYLFPHWSQMSPLDLVAVWYSFSLSLPISVSVWQSTLFPAVTFFLACWPWEWLCFWVDVPLLVSIFLIFKSHVSVVTAAIDSSYVSFLDPLFSFLVSIEWSLGPFSTNLQNEHFLQSNQHLFRVLYNNNHCWCKKKSNIAS